MNSTISGLRTEIMYLYSAHDTTVMAIITALGLTSSECIYALYNKKVSPSKYCFKYPKYTSNI